MFKYSGSTPIKERACRGSFHTSTPPTQTDPEVGRNSPTIILIVVLLPAPLGPRKPKNSPRLTVKLRLSTAFFWPNTRTRSRVTIAAGIFSCTEYVCCCIVWLDMRDGLESGYVAMVFLILFHNSVSADIWFIPNNKCSISLVYVSSC